MIRRDYAYPFRLDSMAHQGAIAPSYASHVDDMIRQVLLTDPGERADLPEFGCGLRRLIFAPNSDALAASVQILVQQSLNRWLSQQITVQSVAVDPPEQTADQGILRIRIQYVLNQTQAVQGVEVLVQ